MNFLGNKATVFGPSPRVLLYFLLAQIYCFLLDFLRVYSAAFGDSSPGGFLFCS